MTRSTLAIVVTVVGLVFVSGGAALVFFPAGLITAGLSAVGVGLLGIDDGGAKR